MTKQNTSVNFLRSKAGMILGFITGMTAFLFLFKIIILDRTSPADELAPGIVMIAAIISGMCFAFVGRWAQNYWTKTR
ncbi:hypothetical protein HQ865_08965 [Mucilaginibacter mali]|uniref:Uncharacterized protein n=1 Tax=Mucilaginibacter mali TaxID=2740462 RepID=A0A7D4UP63_9SPHI|nr:hypothetical protein [Mucilaginibacter mali]QKJ29880.1 hypothetical protein HQ865_08965 [Mucilaginibacter mali]